MSRFLFPILTVAATLLLGGPRAQALDRVQTNKGQLSGTIESMSPTEIVLSRRGKPNETIPANSVQLIQYDGEDPKLGIARKAAIDGRYDVALAALNDMAQQPDLRPEILLDINYYQAYCAAQLALSGTGDVKEAGKQLRDYVEANPKTFHLYEAYELLGDLFVAVGAYDAAEEYYDRVADAPWPDSKMRALVAKGRALRNQKKFDEAQQAFDAALAIQAPDDDPLATAVRRTATLGKAACMADLSQYEEAIAMTEEVIAGAASAEDAAIHAEAYTTLGNCYRKAGKPKDALLAFLHVDLLYPSYPRQHAEALANLIDLWTDLGQRQRAQETSQLLQQRYADSPWAK